jgi:hypothetical protein
MPQCACGCGEDTRGGIYRPGHDACLRAQLEYSVGGLLALKEIVESIQRHRQGELSPQTLSHQLNQILDVD